ncbi:hypothetical protein GALMADRAFT_243530 [Galerina marginata CBS 339.88]|uniref:Uncharacterized protein n=1 Tax=Galerina marginata (strain CBS 339.88) TaxID=685588 RepID=A0A067T8M1_GALM3|nr:hypothetical protein GALMADRAFT_243530 [Galerina marginata CBS 339.88]
MSNTVIDDQDLTRVKYTGTWVRGGSAHEHDETVASTANVGDYLTVKFKGTSIAVYGTIDSTSGGVLTNYSIDGATPVQVVSQAGSGDTFNQQFWKSPVLSLGEHNLVATMVQLNNNSGPGEGTIWFDYFLATDPTIPSGPAAQRKHVGVIAGSVVAGVVALLVAALAFIFLRRRRRKEKEAAHVQPIYWPKNEIDSESASPFNVGHSTARTVEPFFLDSHHGHHPSSPSTTSSPTSDSDAVPRKSALLHETRRQTVSTTVIHPMPPPSLTTSSTSNGLGNVGSSPLAESPRNTARKHQQMAGVHERDASNSYAPPALQPLQHVDSGVRSINVETGNILPSSIELPPVYSPV